MTISRPFAWPFAQTDAWSTTILINEFNTGGLEGATNGNVIRDIHGCFAVSEFGATDGRDADRASLGQVFGGPADERTGRADLRAG
jgi:hypothetical protein